MKRPLLYALFFFFSLFPIITLAANWEYQVKSYLITGDDQYLTNEMNRLGTKGWELVNCTSLSQGGKIVCTFKRELAQ